MLMVLSAASSQLLEPTGALLELHWHEESVPTDKLNQHQHVQNLITRRQLQSAGLCLYQSITQFVSITSARKTNQNHVLRITDLGSFHAATAVGIYQLDELAGIVMTNHHCLSSCVQREHKILGTGESLIWCTIQASVLECSLSLYVCIYIYSSCQC